MKSLKYDMIVIAGLLTITYGLSLVHEAIAFVFIGLIVVLVGMKQYSQNDKG